MPVFPAARNVGRALRAAGDLPAVFSCQDYGQSGSVIRRKPSGLNGPHLQHEVAGEKLELYKNKAGSSKKTKGGLV